MEQPQCQYYVLRKKRLCRMTVRPGKQYCGEHEPQPATDDIQDNTRIPCPNDPKHTCYASKLQKHLSICNARSQVEPDYIERNVNVPLETETDIRRPLNEYTQQQLRNLIEKVNRLYEEHVEGNIDTIPELPIHDAVRAEFELTGRTESSRRHLRQVSTIMHLIEAEGLVCHNTCYVELGAGKGHLSVFVSRAWCGAGSGSRVLLVERAPLRHKRENTLRGCAPADDASAAPALRLRADLAHLRLRNAPVVPSATAVVGLAKHLCGVATDYALRCITADFPSKTVGMVIATCCHHRCELSAYVGELQKLGISNEEFNIMLGVVSWATCGDGRARTPRAPDHKTTNTDESANSDTTPEILTNDTNRYNRNVSHNTDGNGSGNKMESKSDEKNRDENSATFEATIHLDARDKEVVGRRAKALLDWGRAEFLRRRGFHVRLCHFVSRAVSPENVCIVAAVR